jgi:hypothetical protein
LQLALNRANSVYLCVFAGFVIGIWVILDLGSAFLTAPRDLSGRWKLAGDSGEAKPAEFTVAQSGEFVRFAFERGPTFDVVLATSPTAAGQLYSFRGHGWSAWGSGSGVGEILDFKFLPPGNFHGSIPSGTYQRERIGQGDATQLQSPGQSPQGSSPNGH